MKLRAYLLMLFVVAVWDRPLCWSKARWRMHAAAFNLVRMTLAFAVLGVAYHRYWRAIRGWQVAAGALVGCAWPWLPVPNHGLALTTPPNRRSLPACWWCWYPVLYHSRSAPPEPGRRAGMPSWRGDGLYRHCAADRASRHPGSAPASLLGHAARLLPDMTSINLGDLLTLGCAIGFAFTAWR